MEDRALERLEQILGAGIEVHVQLVLVPGVNDGEVLQRTLEWLAPRAGVASVGVVPLGYTGHQKRFAASYSEPGAAAAVLDAIEPWRAAMTAERGIRWVHAADEFYLAAGRHMPPEDEYDGFPQYENGIGMTRSFTDEWMDAVSGTPVEPDRPQTSATLITGTLFAPVLTRLAPMAERHGVSVRVLGVENRFFGGNVSVTGLLTGADIAAAVAEDDGRGPYMVPDVVFNEDGLTLDGLAIERAARARG